MYECLKIWTNRIILYIVFTYDSVGISRVGKPRYTDSYLLCGDGRGPLLMDIVVSPICLYQKQYLTDASRNTSASIFLK